MSTPSAIGKTPLVGATAALPLLPAELWAEIFLFLRPMDSQPDISAAFSTFVGEGETISTLRSVSLTCKASYLIALPLRFEKIAIYFGSGGNLDAKSLLKLQRLHAQPEVRAWVKVLGIYGTRNNGKLCVAPEKVEEVFIGMKNVTELMFEGFKVTDHIFTHLFRLYLLNHLVIREVEIEENLPIPTSDAVANLTIESISVFQLLDHTNSIPRPFAPLLFAPQMHQIALCNILAPSRFTELIARHKSIPLLKLHSLTIYSPTTTEEFNTFHDFLRCTPNLRYLSMHRHFTGIDAPFPADAAPCLEEYNGSIDMANIVVPGRPVHSIMVIRGRDPIEVSAGTLRPLSLGTVPVQVLELRSVREWQEDQFPLVARLFPALRHLLVELSNFSVADPTNWGLSHFAAHIALFKRLRFLWLARFNSDGVTAGQELSALTSVDEHHPLEVVKLPSGRRWLKKDGHWIEDLNLGFP